jgi:hypothetical protein
MHVNNIECYVLCSWVLQGAERDKQSYNTNWVNSFATEALP